VDNGLRYALAFLLPLAGTPALTPVAAKVARALGAMDRPSPNKVHRQATPYLGGRAVVGGLMVVAALTAGASGELVTILAGGLALFLLGLIDDWRTVSPATKILVEVGAAVALWVVGARRAVRQRPRSPVHGAVGRGGHERVQPARQHGLAAVERGRGGRPHVLRDRSGPWRLPGRVVLARRGGSCPRFPGPQLPPGPDLHGRRRLAAPRLPARVHRPEARPGGTDRPGADRNPRAGLRGPPVRHGLGGGGPDQAGASPRTWAGPTTRRTGWPRAA